MTLSYKLVLALNEDYNLILYWSIIHCNLYCATYRPRNSMTPVFQQV